MASRLRSSSREAVGVGYVHAAERGEHLAEDVVLAALYLAAHARGPYHEHGGGAAVRARDGGVYLCLHVEAVGL